MADLDALSRTALIPLWARAQDARLDAPILADEAAAALAAAAQPRFGPGHVGESTRAGCCLRGRAMDDWLVRLAEGNDVRTVVEIGVGLDTRMSRMPGLFARAVEIDSEPIIKLRDEFLPDMPAERVVGDGMDVTTWIDAVDGSAPSTTALVLQGVLSYQQPARVARFFADAARLLPGAFLLFDSLSPLAAWPANRPAALAQGRPRYRWTPWRTRAVMAGDRRIRVLAEKGFLDFPRELTREFSAGSRVAFVLPPMRRAYRLTLAKLPE